MTDQSGTYTAEDIYIGDIWVCVGQSNMMFPMTRMHKEANGIQLAKMLTLWSDDLERMAGNCSSRH